MGKVTRTNKQLLLLRNEIDEFSKNSISFSFFNSEKIKRFRTYNAIRIQSADEKLRRLITKFVKHDDNGKPIKLDDQGIHAKYDFLDADAEKAFKIEYDDFMNRNITIEY